MKTLAEKYKRQVIIFFLIGIGGIPVAFALDVLAVPNSASSTGLWLPSLTLLMILGITPACLILGFYSWFRFLSVSSEEIPGRVSNQWRWLAIVFIAVSLFYILRLFIRMPF